MNKKTRGYIDLSVCIALLYVGAALCFSYAGLCLLAAGSGTSPSAETSIAYAMASVGFTVGYIAAGGLLRLAIHVADDLYFLRLIKVNEYHAKTQKPPPKVTD